MEASMEKLEAGSGDVEMALELQVNKSLSGAGAGQESKSSEEKSSHMSPSNQTSSSSMARQHVIDQLEQASSAEEIVRILKELQRPENKGEMKQREIEIVIRAMGKKNVKAHQSSEDIQVLACGILGDLAKTGPRLRVDIAKHKGIEAVLAAMRAHPAGQPVQQQACGALGSLAVNADNQVKIAGLGGIEAVLAAVKAFLSSEDLLPVALNLLACFSSKESKSLMRELGAGDLVSSAMKRFEQNAIIPNIGKIVLEWLQ
ncbi:hypothetical protein GUITHDRAFT_117946 [Guillardia theta CCMP2712]|uniref:Armadillo repeat-containing domain-containing protein n=1 Tax=Guillardia theta (strain CCMP2712) TaxID=905079 RepID=L1II41_GUITC|nr:hypothetical protein GUITHDRAFT_117946 [Guillardia theta CCMP2712]EKX35913.1 hypothetical protein GUITHDRAFT_117946 [Guillardia theta CCMP2712]|eukprot:XP_005822893.1 hypothetical protein GUITHDRAFT_117946 [Guillardia theta CCMP2712]